MPELIRPVFISRPLDVLALAENRDWGLDSLKITNQTWQGSQGEGVLYVVGDTGLAKHRDAKAPVFVQNFSSSNTTDDRQGHGSHVAGTVIGQRNDWGFVGIAPGAGYAVVKLLGDDGSNSTDRINQGYYWLAEWWKTRSEEMRRKYHSCVFNLSIGGPRDSASTRAIKALFDAGVVVFAAMGNSGKRTYESPGIDAIGVAALDRSDKRASFSTYNEFTDVACPGVNTVSFGPRDSFIEMSGTSMASPYASGCGVLTLSLNRDPALRTHDGLIRYWTSSDPFDVDAPGKDQATGLGKPNVSNPQLTTLFDFGVAA